MNIFEENEKKLHRMINEHKRLYFNIEVTDKDFEEEINNSYNSLLKIQEFLNKRLRIESDTLMSKIYVSNRKKIRDEDDQYRKEIYYKTQCLKKENLISIQDNNEKKYLIFNKIPYEHFKYIGMTTGNYEITILDSHPFGILYDNEEYPNKEFNYETVEKNIVITGGTPHGDPKTIREDKWIMAPGDELGDEDSEALINIGPYDFTIQFYTGTINIEVLGDFGTVSFYCYNHGYMGGQKRLKYSDICLIPT
jgi:hypothetical protein